MFADPKTAQKPAIRSYRLSQRYLGEAWAGWLGATLRSKVPFRWESVWEVEVDLKRRKPIGRIGNLESMDHPKNQPRR